MDDIQFIPDNQKKVAGFSDKKKSLGYLQLGGIIVVILALQIGVLQSVLQLRLGVENQTLETRLSELNAEIPAEYQNISQLTSLIGLTGSLSGQASSVGDMLASLRLETLSTVKIQRINYVKRTQSVRLTVVATSVDELILQEDRFAQLPFVSSVENSNIQSVQGTQSVAADINLTLK